MPCAPDVRSSLPSRARAARSHARSVRCMIHAAAAPSICISIAVCGAVCALEHVDVGMPLAAGVEEGIALGPARMRPVHVELCSTGEDVLRG
jgi:hypothetical protein